MSIWPFKEGTEKATKLCTVTETTTPAIDEWVKSLERMSGQAVYWLWLKVHNEVGVYHLGDDEVHAQLRAIATAGVDWLDGELAWP